MKRLSVRNESPTGLYPNYHVRTQQDTGKKFIASNPDRSKRNNLG